MAFRTASDAADRLLSGAAPLEGDVDTPEVERLLTALRSPLSPDGAREQEAVRVIAAAMAAAPVRLDDARRSRHRLLKVAAIAGGLVMLVGTAAAATGSFPDRAQSAVARALSHVDVHVPDPHDGGAGATDAAGRAGSDRPVGPDPTGDAHRGLCTAWAARNRTEGDRGRSGDATAFTNLRRAAHDQGEPVEQFCADVLGAGTPSSDGSSAAPGRSDDVDGRPVQDQGRSGEDHGRSAEDHGQSGEDHGAVVDTPNPGGISTGTGASNGANADGAGHASDPASAGSTNAGEHPAPPANRSH